MEYVFTGDSDGVGRIATPREQRCNSCGKPRDITQMELGADGENYCNHISCFRVGFDREIKHQRNKALTITTGVKWLIHKMVEEPQELAWIIGFLTALVENGVEE